MLEGRDRRTVAWLVAAALAAILALRWLGGAQGEAPPIALTGPADRAPAAAAGRPAARGASEEVWVHVAGAVGDPGLYRLPAGVRVAAAIDAAGGMSRRADAAAVNLAARVTDGQQVVVPRRGEAAPAATAGAAGGPGSGAPRISLSTATAEQLDALDGIGETLARRIVEYREQHGFRSIDDLREVEGIGDKRFEALRDAVVP